MRRAAAVDANQSELVKLARRMGFSVAVTSALGRGFPDIVLGKFGFTFLAEIKDGKKSPSQRNLTNDEQTFHEKWQGHICIIESVEQLEALHLAAMEYAAKIRNTFTVCPPSPLFNSLPSPVVQPAKRGKRSDA